jgi:hypothetical protein
MITRQPKSIKVKNVPDKKIYNLPSSEIPCVLQDREEGDDSEVVYIHNPKYIKGSKEEAPYIAFTKREYEAVEWTE